MVISVKRLKTPWMCECVIYGPDQQGRFIIQMILGFSSFEKKKKYINNAANIAAHTPLIDMR